MADDVKVATKPKSKKNSGGKPLIVWGGLCLPLAVVLWPSFILLGISLAPTVFAFFFERAQQKHLTSTIGLMNLCGSLPALVTLWEVGHNHTTMLALLQNPSTWILAYLFAAAGFLIYLGAAFFVAQYHRSTMNTRLNSLERKQAELVEAWGDGVVTEQARYFASFQTAEEVAADDGSVEAVVEPAMAEARPAS